MAVIETLIKPTDLSNQEDEPESDGRGGYRLTGDEIEAARNRREKDDLARIKAVATTEKPTEFDEEGIPLN